MHVRLSKSADMSPLGKCPGQRMRHVHSVGGLSVLDLFWSLSMNEKRGMLIVLRKLFLETEEAVRIQLSDVERSIMAIHKASPPLLVIILH
ncbi:hypothetical protein ACLOJK_022150 [Asimina triloba]